MTRTIAPPTSACRIAASSTAVAPSPINRLCISTMSTVAMTPSNTDADGADPVPHRVAGRHAEADPGQRKDEAYQGAGVLQQHDGKLGATGGPDELPPAGRALQRTGLVHRGPEAVALQSDSDDQHPDRNER